MKMTDFCCSDKKANTPETMWAPLNSVLAANGALEQLYCAKPRSIEQHSSNHQSGIEQLRQAGYSCQPPQLSDDRFEHHRFRSDNVLMCSISRKWTRIVRSRDN